MSRDTLRAGIAWTGILAVTLNTLLPPAAVEAGKFWPVRETTVQRLARQIDLLERHLDQYGTVVAKSPDVWGEARLTKYRAEYEKALKKELESFNSTINAAISRSDQAFLSSALALQAAVSNAPIMNAPPPASTSESIQSVTSTETKPAAPSPAPSEPAPPDSDSAIPDPAEADLGGTVELTKTDLVKESSLLGFGGDKVALEPTIHLDQLSRYLQHLQELRRINDGDDKADAPGYALHLVRLPVSVLPGKTTREGYGAEVSVIARPHLHEELLPITFRGLVINDLVDHFAFPLAKFLDRPDAAEILAAFSQGGIDPRAARFQQTIALLKQKTGGLSNLPDQAATQLAELLALVAQARSEASGVPNLAPAFCTLDEIERVLAKAKADLDAAAEKFTLTVASADAATREFLVQSPPMADSVPESAAPSAAGGGGAPATERVLLDELIRRSRIRMQAWQPAQAPEQKAKIIRQQIQEIARTVEAARSAVESTNASQVNLSDVTNKVVDLSARVEETIAKVFEASEVVVPAIAITPSRRSTLPFPLTQAFEVYGGTELGHLALMARAIKDDPLNQPATLLLDMQKLLTEELHAAYEFLNANPHLWESCTPEVAAAVRGRNAQFLDDWRDQFIANCSLADDQRHTGSLAWAIIVESSLLNERLNQDIRELAAAKNALFLPTDWQPFFGPCPPPEARFAFNEYVRCRWPIHVLALDPVTQDQNVADSFSMRREMQLSLSLAFASGQMGAQNFNRYARRIELDMESIALNRTAVGFSHGDDVFGWRFYPRVQSPEIEGTCRTITRTLFHGGFTRDAMLKDQRLEPGIRECTAIVIMPSFVPYVIFDMRTNWFKLNNPARKQLNLVDGVDLSAEVTQLRSLQRTCAADAHLYRQDEVYRLTRAVDQLEERLPLQSVYVQMPFDNSLGGFEFFNSGVPDLAPELKGFYGEPGILAPAATNSTIFLVGDHFSVHDTKVIVGNQDVTASIELLSRQVMKVVVPGTVLPVDGQVDCHVATPYGVSNHIQIPIVSPVPPPEAVAATATQAVHDALGESFAFDIIEVTARVTLAADRTVQEVKLLQPVQIKAGVEHPFELPLADFGGIVFEVRKGVPKEERKADFIIPTVAFDKKAASLQDPVVPRLASGIREALVKKNYQLPTDVDHLFLVGFLRFWDGAIETDKAKFPAHPDARPVYRLIKPLKIKLEICDPFCPPACPAPLPGSQPTLEAIPCPPTLGPALGTPLPAPAGFNAPRISVDRMFH
jgi:hypothetical protein